LPWEHHLSEAAEGRHKISESISGGEALVPDEILIVYVTCPTLEDARRIGHALVERRLAACVNIRTHEAIYRWEGKLESGPEVGLIAKTTRTVFPCLREAVLEMHSYALPCIVAMEAVEGHAGFLDWVANEVRDQAESQ
jgi:periplasmic divalent cation tolerance protein